MREELFRLDDGKRKNNVDKKEKGKEGEIPLEIRRSMKENTQSTRMACNCFELDIFFFFMASGLRFFFFMNKMRL
jgi:hypothetical protein